MQFPKPMTYRSRRYLDHVRKRPCLACGNPVVDVHHVSFHDAGFGQKSGDLTSISLCRVHHSMIHQNPKQFKSETKMGREEIYEEIIANLKTWIEDGA